MLAPRTAFLGLTWGIYTPCVNIPSAASLPESAQVFYCSICSEPSAGAIGNAVMDAKICKYWNTPHSTGGKEHILRTPFSWKLCWGVCKYSDVNHRIVPFRGWKMPGAPGIVCEVNIFSQAVLGPQQLCRQLWDRPISCKLPCFMLWKQLQTCSWEPNPSTDHSLKISLLFSLLGFF